MDRETSEMDRLGDNKIIEMDDRFKTSKYNYSYTSIFNL